MSAPAPMSTLGLELADVGLMAARDRAAGADPQPLVVPNRDGAREWPGYAYSDGKTVTLGRAAEDLWFVHPRRVDLQFWARLGHDPSALQVNGKTLSSSELAFLFLREFLAQLDPAAGRPARVVLAVPGAYLRDPAIEEERIGLLLGLAHELKLPLAGVVDAGLAALCDPRGPGCDSSLPVVLIDASLTGSDLTLLEPRAGRLARAAHLHLPQAGLATLRRLLTAALGNRFLRHTAFDILTDGRVEQAFFRQVHDFLQGDADEHRFLINTGTRTYEMNAKREQLAADAPGPAAAIVQGLQELLARRHGGPAPGTVALTDRAARIPGLEARLRAVAPARLVRLPAEAAAIGAARLGQEFPEAPVDLAEVPVWSEIDQGAVTPIPAGCWRLRIARGGTGGPETLPTHLVFAGLAHPLPRQHRLTFGPPSAAPDLPLPLSPGSPAWTLLQEGGRWRLADAGAEDPGAPLAAGDRLELTFGDQRTELLLVHCLPSAAATG
ncbi:MAG: hypothetical protein ACO3JJ_06490 [Opitutaceae bacterium]